MAWLLPLFPPLARAAARVYYRLTLAGGRVATRGPALLVANHPNSLLDPVLVQAAVGRPVRFLAKAPLFVDRKVGWLVRGAGAIPVYRASDDPGQMGRNEDMFRAVHAALAAGHAVGIFPEGLSHSEPGLAPLRTGAARIALGVGRAFPIVPVGLVFRAKDVFRSDALVLIGEAIGWDDLASRGTTDADAVRQLTTRIDAALRRVTVNLERWEDRPLAECAVRVWEAERSAPPEPAERVGRLEVTTRILAAMREHGDAGALALASDVRAHCARLARLRLRPADLRADVGLGRGLTWGARRLPLVLPLAAVVALLGFLLFFVPWWLTGHVAARFRPEPDQGATYKLLGGIVLYGLWLAVLAVLAWALVAPWAALVVLVATPAVGMTGLLVRERWRGDWRDARRFLLLRTRGDLAAQLAERQRALAERLHVLYESSLARGILS
jgi:1-acyl-sn-glycerol-3-phosphate acyltransferase